MPMARANSTTALYDSSLVLGVPMTSAVLFFQMLLAKCSARKRSSRPVKPIIALGSRVEEFVHRMVCCGRMSLIEE